MKKRIIPILAIAALNIGLVSANNLRDKNLDGPSALKPDLMIESLAPVAPAEATFEESMDAFATHSELFHLAPATPAEASFDEIIPDKVSKTDLVAPETPKEATFGDE